MKLSFIYGQTKYYIPGYYNNMNHHHDSGWGLYFTVARALNGDDPPPAPSWKPRVMVSCWYYYSRIHYLLIRLFVLWCLLAEDCKSAWMCSLVCVIILQDG